MVRGIGRLHLGELETAVLEELWRRGTASVKQVHADLANIRAVSHNSVQTTLERLFRKRILSRTKVSHAYHYTPRVGRKDLLEIAVGDVIERLAGASPEPVLSAFVDLTARAGEDTLRRLEALVAARLERDQEDQE